MSTRALVTLSGRRARTRAEYDPPATWDDPRVCRRCRVANGSWNGARYVIQNARTGVYHSGGAYGVTDCGTDATGDLYRWPL